MGKVLVVRMEGLPAVGEIELGTRKRDRHQGSEIKALPENLLKKVSDFSILHHSIPCK